MYTSNHNFFNGIQYSYYVCVCVCVCIMYVMYELLKVHRHITRLCVSRDYVLNTHRSIACIETAFRVHCMYS